MRAAIALFLLAVELASAASPSAPDTELASAASPSAPDTELASAASLSTPATEYAPVVPGHPITFPDDYGSHPQFRTEWWYVTGWLRTPQGDPLGFQVTFFRTKPAIDERNPSAFTPRQLLIAHCAISDPAHGRLWQDQRIRRAGQGLAEATEHDTRVWIDRWSLARVDEKYQVDIDAQDFAMRLSLRATEAPLINGRGGVSQKGPTALSASYYYSLPHLAVSGTVTRQGTLTSVDGEAWFDHEWSSEYLDPAAEGWDWIGLNLDDGASLMAFRIRGIDGNPLWSGGTYRAADGKTQVLGNGDVRFDALRHWVSPRTGIHYPVEWTVHAAAQDFHLRPLMDDQENDTRLSTGAIYWEGAVRALRDDRPVGKGYLELTGYGERLKLR